MSTVYVGMTEDILHHGHINIIECARYYGEVIIGLLTDQAIARCRRPPSLGYEQRKRILENIAGVSRVVPQEERAYSPNLEKYRPDYMIHGDDWRFGSLRQLREETIRTLERIGAKLIEVPYPQGDDSIELSDPGRAAGITPDNRRRALRRQLDTRDCLRILETHNPISALIAETVSVEHSGRRITYDGFWSSSLTDSTARGKPDIEAVDMTSRLMGINDIFEVTTRPLIIDGDTGGKLEHFELNVRSMERLGISAVIIEDKTGLKRNSLFGTEVVQTQDSIPSFCAKIEAGKRAQVTKDFMIIARIESLILNAGMNDAIQRAFSYVEAGADGIMIHSRQKTADEVFEFARRFRQRHHYVPLVCVPTTYAHTGFDELAGNGFNIIIYANQMLRAAYPAMHSVATDILHYGRTLEVEDRCMSINQILDLLPGAK